MTCATRHNRTLDLCFGTVPEAYSSMALPPLGTADHDSVLLAPVYKPVVPRFEKIIRTVQTWTAESIECLRGCFDCTDWHMFYDSTSNLTELVDVISSYVTYCSPVAEGFRRRTLASNLEPLPKSHPVDDAGSSPVRAEMFSGYHAAKVH